MENGLVSVILPVYNGRSWLSKTLDSVVAQTYRPIEIVAVDDGSRDDSFAYLSAYGEPLRAFRQENCGSVGLVRNACMARARGEFFAFLDQDDWWHPEKLEKQITVMRSSDRVGLVHTAVSHFLDATGRECDPLNPEARPDLISGACFEELLLGNSICNSSVMVRRTAVDEVGPCDPRVPGNTVQDYDLWLRIARRYECGFVAERLTVYRLHPGQGFLDRRAMLHAELDVLFRMRRRAEWFETQRGRQRIADLYDSLAVAYCDQGQFQVARVYFRLACRTMPGARRGFRYASSLLPASLVNGVRGLKGRLAGVGGRS